MKKILTIILAFVSVYSSTAQVSQVLTFEQVKNAQKRSEINNGEIEEYVSENGTVFKIGDVLKINQPSNGQIFSSMTKRMSGIEALGLNQYEKNNYDYNVYARTIAKTSLKIKSFVIEGNKKQGFSIAANLDGVGNNLQVRLDYGLEIGEIGEYKMTSSDALAKLKSEKDKLDLGLITKEQFDASKAELSKYIK